MPDPATQTCPHREAVEALARDVLPDDRRRFVQRHLEHCEPCRSAFRKLTADWFPRLRNYTIVERIGVGGFGEVYKAVHHAKERTEALKVLYAETRIRTASFENEARLIAGLRHPNIATLYDAHLGPPPFYYTMEYVEGRPLDDYFRSPDVSLAERIEIYRQVALAMDYAHRQGVVHRDLKPRNILIDTAGQPRIVDFGIARKLALTEDEGDVAVEPPSHPDGTYGYIAPEEEAGGSVDGRADIYALGVLLYHGATGRPLSSDGHLGDLTSILRQGRISHAGDLAAIIVRCLHEDPARRYSTCAELAEDLGRFLAGGPVRARVRRPLGYHAARSATAAFRSHQRFVRCALIIVVAALLIAMFRRGQASWLAAGTETRQVVLIAFAPSTIDAIRDRRVGADLAGLTLRNRKTWRMLYGRIMEALAPASPRAVVWDYYFPDCQPEYDAAFLRGIDALQANGIPVVIGCKDFDVNAAPLGCEQLLAAAHAYGALHAAEPGTASDEFVVPICFRRGLAPPVPGLSVVGFAAAQHPDCQLDLRIEDERVLACYRRNHFAKGEPEWRTEVDEFPLAADEHDRISHVLPPDGEVLYARVRQATADEWAGRIIPFEDVLTASHSQLQTWFAGRVVVAGQMLPGQDVHPTKRGAEIYGCQVHAQALDAFLAQGHLRRTSYWGLVLRTFLWCALAGIIAHLVPVGPLRALRLVTFICLGSCALGMMIGVICLTWMFSPWFVEAAIAVCAILVAGSLTYLCKAVYVKQAWIASGAAWPSSHETEP
ncbi:MAG: protein kinase, partial [Planctomycetes bacterium]|nr:protein kinase [Planctomycetota bacterium]